jgi:hypothetical protein
MSEFRSFRPVPPFSLPLEGRLLAHRRLLVELLRALPEDRYAEMLGWLDENRLYRTDQDNPEGVSSDRIEMELARADEIQVLKRMVEAASE